LCYMGFYGWYVYGSVQAVLVGFKVNLDTIVHRERTPGRNWENIIYCC
jgi:hypothetical protein